MGWILDILKEIPISAVLKERIVEREKEIEAIKAENEALRAENRTLKSQRAMLAAQDEFLERSGVLWRKNSAGGYEEFPYCPKCKFVLAQFRARSLNCSQCAFVAPFHPSQLAEYRPAQ